PPTTRSLFYSAYALPRDLPSFPTRRSSDLARGLRHRLGRLARELARRRIAVEADPGEDLGERARHDAPSEDLLGPRQVSEARGRSEEHTSELQSPCNLVCRLLLEKKKKHDS